MRIDKFLKMSRLIKGRTMAREACKEGRVKIDNKIVKPDDDVKIGDIIEISLGQGEFKCRVVDPRDHVGKNEAQPLCESL